MTNDLFKTQTQLPTEDSMEQSVETPATNDLMKRLTAVATRTSRQYFNSQRRKITLERTGKGIDANLWSWYFTIGEEELGEVSEGDVIIHESRRWRVTGSARVACGLAYYKYKRIG